MADTNSGEQYQPHFVIPEDLEPQTAETLRALEAAINGDPEALLRAVTPPGPAAGTPEREFLPAVAVATSKDVVRGFGFDELSEDFIAGSAVMKLLHQKRKENQRNEALSDQLAAEVRRTRLALFISRVAEHRSASADVIEMPARPKRIRTRKGISA